VQDKPHAYSYSDTNVERKSEGDSHAEISPDSKGAAYSTAASNTGSASTVTASYPSVATHAASAPDAGAASSFAAPHCSATAQSLGPG